MTSSFRPGMAKMKNKPLPKLAQAQPISTFNTQPTYQPAQQSQPTYQPSQPSYSPQPQPQSQTQVRYSPQPITTHQQKTFQPNPAYQPQQSYSPRSPSGGNTNTVITTAPIQRAVQAVKQGIQYNTGGPTIGTLKSWAAHQKFLDIYMVNAFYTGTAQRSQYLMSLWKTVSCFGLQFIGICLLMADQWEAYKASSNGACGGIRGSVALVGYFFATYITIFCTEQIRSLNRYGMYGWGEQQPDFVNPLWVGVGLWVNLISLILSWFVSCIIIFTSEDILNMVLNSVAVTFMLTLDDEIIGASDYSRVANWDGVNNTCRNPISDILAKVGGLLLKIHPCWQRKVQIQHCYRAVDCCDCFLCPFMIILPFIILFCYPYDDAICLYEEPALCG